MGNYWYHKSKNLFINSSISSIPREIFYIFTLTILTLLLPLSFLLLARLSSAQFYLQNLINLFHHSNSPNYILSIALKINPFILYPLVSIVTIASLIHGLTGKKITFFRDSSSSPSSSNVKNILQPRLCFAWILLCAFQVCVGLGIEGSIEAGVYSYDSDYDESMSFGVERSLLSRVIFLLGLHETTQVWSKVVVKPVVDDTVLGGVMRKERVTEKLAMAASLGILWWWKLRDDVEILVVMAEVKKEQMIMEVGICDYFGWWLYYVTVITGMVRVVKGLMWMFMICVCRRRRTTQAEIFTNEENVDKV